MNRKAQLGSVMTWFGATLLVVIILAISFILAGYVSIEDGKSREMKDKLIDVRDLEVDMQILELVDKNYKEISEWADDDFVLVHFDWISGEVDEKMEAVCSKFEEDEDILNLKGKDFYLVIEGDVREVIRISDSGERGSFLCSTSSSNQGISNDFLMPVISFEGNKVGVGYV